MMNIESKRVLTTLVNENDKINEVGGKEKKSFISYALEGIGQCRIWKRHPPAPIGVNDKETEISVVFLE